MEAEWSLQKEMEVQKSFASVYDLLDKHKTANIWMILRTSGVLVYNFFTIHLLCIKGFFVFLFAFHGYDLFSVGWPLNAPYSHDSAITLVTCSHWSGSWLLRCV